MLAAAAGVAILFTRELSAAAAAAAAAAWRQIESSTVARLIGSIHTRREAAGGRTAGRSLD